MTQEEKQLLIQDLCGRLPYGVKMRYKYLQPTDFVPFATSIRLAEEKIALSRFLNKEGDWFPIIEADEILIKPYLRPLSSMTEEEKRELSKKYVWNIWSGQIQIRYHSQGCWDDETECPTEEYIILFDWLNKNHFDYRGLIGKGLALEAPEGMYVKNKCNLT